MLAVNPPAPFSPSDNILDPNCLPTDSNCYVSISNLTLNSATTTNLSVLADTALGGNLSLSGATSTVTNNVVTTVVPSVNSYGVYNDSEKQVAVSPVDGFVRFVYSDQNTWDRLYLVRCLDNDCSTSTTTTVAVDSNYPDYATIALGPDNLPRISYVSYSSPNEIHYIQCLNESCSSNTNQVVATSTHWFYEQSLAIGSDGLARIAYEDYDSGSLTALKLARCTDASCSSKTITTVATATGSYLIPRIALDSSDVVHIAYTNYLYASSTVSGLYYTTCLDASCSSNTTNTIDASVSSYNTSLTLTQAGLPYIAYEVRGSSGAVTGIKYANCLDTLCAVKSTVVLKNQGAPYYTVSAVLDSNNLARIVYSNRTTGVGYVQCLNASCTSSKVSTPVSGASYPATIAMGQDSLPRILLATNNTHDLSVVRLIADDGRASVTGQTFGSWFKSIGEIFASRVTTQLLDVAGSSTIAGDLRVDGKIETNVFNIQNTASSSGVVTGTINMGGVPFIHNYSAGTDCGNVKSSVFIGVNAGNQTMARTDTDYRCWFANYNVGIGDNVLKNLTTGFGNVAVGGNSLMANTSGYTNLSFGRDSLNANTVGIGNIAIGSAVLTKNVGGSNNVALGASAGANIGESTATSSNNVFLGVRAGFTQTIGDNNIALGYNTSLASTTGSNQLVIGNFLYGSSINSLTSGLFGIGSTTPIAKLSITAGGAGTGTAFVVADNTNTQKFTILDNGKVGIGTSSPLYLLHAGNVSTSGVVARFENSSGYCDINPTTTSLTCTSDIRLKKNIVTLDASTTLENLNKLNAVTYNWNTEDNASSTHAGFIAQEVQPLFPDLVATDESGLLSVSYSGFIPYLVQAVKTLTEMLGDMKEIFVSKLIKTDKLCINRTHGGEVCVTGDDIDAFMQSRTGSTQQPPQNETTAPTTDTGTTTEQTSEGVVTSSTTPPSIQENITDTPQATSTTESVTPPVEESTQTTNTTQLE